MTSSIANTRLDGSPKKPTGTSAVEVEANRRATRKMAEEMVAGLRKLAQQKNAHKTEEPAA